MKIKRYEAPDLDKIAQALRVLRGRMLGMSWRDLAKLENTTISTLFDRSKGVLGDLITMYSFDGGEGLPEDFRSYYGHEVNNSKLEILDRVGDGKLVACQRYDETVDEMRIDDMIRDWERTTGLTWRKTIELGFDELTEHHDDILTKWDSYSQRQKRYRSYCFGIYDLMDDYEIKKNDHLHPGHAAWKDRVVY